MKWFFFLLVALTLPTALEAVDGVFRTPEDVWRDFDPRKDPLEVEVIRKSADKGVESTEFFFTAMSAEGKKVRVYAIYSVPQGKTKLPGILHIHGGGQTVGPLWNDFWTQRGYAALTFDWYGQHDDRKTFTDWGPYKQGNLRTTDGKAEAVEPTPRISSWYLWTVAARRALTFLEQQPEIDASRLGVFGISMGGTITWYVAGVDRRVRAACAIYGAGWHTYPLLDEESDPKVGDKKIALWRQIMDPPMYAPLVKCPILYLSSTNEHWGKFDYVPRTLAAVKAPHAFQFTPRFMHFIDVEAGQDLPMWMDTWLRGGPQWPPNPQSLVTLTKDGVPQLEITSGSDKRVAKVEAFYAVENLNSMSRYWRDTVVTYAESKWVAPMPVHSLDKPLYAYANIHYAEGWVLSTMPLRVIPSTLGAVRASDVPDSKISDFSKGLEGWVSYSHAVDPIGEKAPIEVKIVRAVDGSPALAVPNRKPIRNHRIGDPKWKPMDGAMLTFSVLSTQPSDITVSMVEPPVEAMLKDGRFFKKKVVLTGDNHWQIVTLNLSDFVTEKGEVLNSWGNITTLQIDPPAVGVPIYRDFFWK